MGSLQVQVVSHGRNGLGTAVLGYEYNDNN